MPSIDTQIAAYLRAQWSAPGRIGPFLFNIDRHSDNKYWSYAVPDDGATPTAADVHALVDAFVSRDRMPRLEYLPGAAPAVEAVLLSEGFVVEGRLPIMVGEAAPPLTDVPGVEIGRATNDLDIAEAVAVQHEAYGDPRVPGPEDIDRIRQLVMSGGVCMLARDTTTGQGAGAGVFPRPHEGVTEIAGVGVRARYRRRGIAEALSARLLGDALRAGVSLPFLMPAGEAEARIYARAGFQPVTEILHISRPS